MRIRTRNTSANGGHSQRANEQAGDKRGRSIRQCLSSRASKHHGNDGHKLIVERATPHAQQTAANPAAGLAHASAGPRMHQRGLGPNTRNTTPPLRHREQPNHQNWPQVLHRRHDTMPLKRRGKSRQHDTRARLAAGERTARTDFKPQSVPRSVRGSSFPCGETDLLSCCLLLPRRLSGIVTGRR